MNRSPIVLAMALAVIGTVRSQDIALPRFEVASIKRNTRGEMGIRIGGASPNRFEAENVWLRFLIQFAWNVKDYRVSGGPGWAPSERYDVSATIDGKATVDQRRLMLQALLEDRFQLMLHRESKDLPVYELMAAKSGIKLQASKEGSCVTRGPSQPPPAPGQNGPRFCGAMMMSPHSVDGTAISMSDLTSVLSETLQRTVIDKTGLSGTFDIHAEWTGDQSTPGFMAPGLAAPGPAPSADSVGRSIFTELQEDLGLKLESAKGPVEVLVIDRLERPSEN